MIKVGGSRFRPALKCRGTANREHLLQSIPASFAVSSSTTFFWDTIALDFVS